MYVALDINPGPGFDTLLLQLILGYIYSAYPHRQFHTLPGLLNSRLRCKIPTLKHGCQAGRQYIL